MSELNTTSIHDLPTDPAGGGSIGGNVSLVANETNYKIPQQQQHQQGQSNMSLDQSTISQIVNGLQQASIAGATSLPSRDIPQNTETIINDPRVQVNYIPTTTNNDYITENEEK